MFSVKLDRPPVADSDGFAYALPLSLMSVVLATAKSKIRVQCHADVVGILGDATRHVAKRSVIGAGGRPILTTQRWLGRGIPPWWSSEQVSHLHPESLDDVHYETRSVAVHKHFPVAAAAYAQTRVFVIVGWAARGPLAIASRSPRVEAFRLKDAEHVIERGISRH